MTTKFPGACSFSAVHGFWWVELVEQVKGPMVCGKVVGGGVLICSERKGDKANCTYGGGEKEYTKHGAVTALVTLA